MQSKSKKALSKNIETEISSGKPQNQAIAIAYDIKRKNSRKKKMAEGGILKKIQDWVEDTGYDSNKEKSNEYVNRDLNPEKAKAFVKGFEGNSQYSKGGEVMKKSFKKMPKMAESSVIKARLLDDEDKYKSGREHYEEGQRRQSEIARKEIENNQGPRAGDLGASLKRDEEMKRKMAEGGKVKKDKFNPDDHMTKLSPEQVFIAKEKLGTLKEPKFNGYSKEADIKNAEAQDVRESEMRRKAKRMAEGGSIEQEMDMQPEEEAEMERHDSIAAAIMAKRRKMAEGGQVDLDENSMEQPNEFYHQNEDVVLKENYASDMQDMTQPMDSNEMGDQSEEDEENKHDMISTIRSRMNRNRQFKG